MKWPNSELTHKSWVGEWVWRCKNLNKDTNPKLIKSVALENVLRSSETVATPLHGLDLGQAWAKMPKKNLHATQNDT